MNNDEVRRVISQGIRWWMRKLNLSLEDLSVRTQSSREYIRKVIAGEDVVVREEFLQRLVAAFGLRSYRIRGYEETEDTYPFDECVKLLKPCPPQQTNMFDDI